MLGHSHESSIGSEDTPLFVCMYGVLQLCVVDWLMVLWSVEYTKGVESIGVPICGIYDCVGRECIKRENGLQFDKDFGGAVHLWLLGVTQFGF